MSIAVTHIILYVADQEASERFYQNLLQSAPALSVPGMTEFELSPQLKLGLMPNSGIARIIGSMPHPSTGTGIPRCELYLKVSAAAEVIRRAIAIGAKPVSDLQPRDWGDTVGYVADPDGHILAIAESA